jgi:RNA polymerase sigma-70 factor (sigma-E family)
MGATDAATGATGVLMNAEVPELFRQHYLALVRLAMRLVDDQDTAEDVVQDVFAALARHRAPISDPPSYLRSAVVNRARSVLRRRRVARAFWSRHPETQIARGSDEPSLRAADRDQMLNAIARLPRRQREAIVLRYYEDLTVAQIADVLGVSPGAVSSALNRALGALAATATEDDHAG